LISDKKIANNSVDFIGFDIILGRSFNNLRLEDGNAKSCR